MLVAEITAMKCFCDVLVSYSNFQISEPESQPGREISLHDLQLLLSRRSTIWPNEMCSASEASVSSWPNAAIAMLVNHLVEMCNIQGAPDTDEPFENPAVITLRKRITYIFIAAEAPAYGFVQYNLTI